MHRRRGRGLKVAALVALLAVCLPRTVAAQSAPVWDPAAAVTAYSTALNAQNLPAALALFDQNGSATDAFGRHFEGHVGLTEFLLGSGFSTPEARITTEKLHVVGNRAVWTYSCSCANGPTDVRLVMNRDKISVFYVVVASPAPPLPQPGLGWVPWLVGVGLLAVGLAGGLGLRRGQAATALPLPQAKQGRLLAALLAARRQRSSA
jgi:hypothetical protein